MSVDAAFIGDIKEGLSIEPEGNVFNSIWGEYERVIISSLITSFGLDGLVEDQYGGDVDTIHNVRKIDSDSNMYYKNVSNEADYNNRGMYDKNVYHSDSTFSKIKREARKEFDNNGTMVDDAYVSGNKLAPRNNNTIPREKQGQLDHVMSAKSIHNDRGRVLAELDGVELANNPGNLRFTNAALNLNKKDMTVEEYISWCEANPDKVNWRGKKGEPLSDDVKQELRKEYNRAKREYDAKLARAYYTSPKFAKDTAKAAGKRGLEMGARQALGFVFTEIWFSVKSKLQNMPSEKDLKYMLEAVGDGIKNGLEIAKKKYKDLIDKVEEGFVAGALSSITTTICNIFFTTAKNLVKCIRQLYASVVQAGKVLLFNPDNLMLGDRIKTSSVILATGASVLVGTVVGEAIGKTPIGSLPIIGEIVQTFSTVLVSGIISCTLLIFLDRSNFINSIVNKLNAIPTEVNNFKAIADAMEQLAAKLSNIDYDKFKKDTEQYKNIALKINNIDSEKELNEFLRLSYDALNISIPWEGDFDEFMGNRSNRLVFS